MPADAPPEVAAVHQAAKLVLPCFGRPAHRRAPLRGVAAPRWRLCVISLTPSGATVVASSPPHPPRNVAETMARTAVAAAAVAAAAACGAAAALLSSATVVAAAVTLPLTDGVGAIPLEPTEPLVTPRPPLLSVVPELLRVSLPPPAVAVAADASTPVQRQSVVAAAVSDDGLRLPDVADHQTLVKLISTLTAALTWFTRPDAYGSKDGAGGRGGTLPRSIAKAARPAAIVTLHGLGGSGPHAVDALRKDLRPATLAYTSLYGPSAYTDRAGNARSWFPIGPVRAGRVPTADLSAGAAANLAAAAARIDAVVAAAVASGVPRRRIVLVGFSLGAATVADYVLAGRAKGLSAVILSAGWRPRPAARVRPRAAAGVRVFIRHGGRDWLIPPRAAKPLAAALTAAGAKVTSVVYARANHFLNDHGAAEEGMDKFIAKVLPP